MQKGLPLQGGPLHSLKEMQRDYLNILWTDAKKKLVAMRYVYDCMPLIPSCENSKNVLRSELIFKIFVFTIQGLGKVRERERERVKRVLHYHIKTKYNIYNFYFVFVLVF